mmetsp:Transcript_29495/g.60456  ORF Transcript_29495/g.60456 Transcript_29495/m.60456 type:complete len:205 (+) Transcript_29495:325-939(+)
MMGGSGSGAGSVTVTRSERTGSGTSGASRSAAGGASIDFLMKNQASAAHRARPARMPMTMPAIAPPERPSGSGSGSTGGAQTSSLRNQAARRAPSSPLKAAMLSVSSSSCASKRSAPSSDTTVLSHSTVQRPGVVRWSSQWTYGCLPSARRAPRSPSSPRARRRFSRRARRKVSGSAMLLSKKKRRILLAILCSPSGAGSTSGS